MSILKFVSQLFNKIYFRLCIQSKFLPNESEYQKYLRNDVLSFYLKKNKKPLTSEEKEVIRYLKKNIIHIFPYSFKNKYDEKKIVVNYDPCYNLRYVEHDKKKMYFKRAWSEEKIKHAYNFLLIEQDPESPHRYLTPDFTVEPGDVVFDIGCAEGNFSLGIIDFIDQLVLFEGDQEWIEPLRITFEPWKDKVTIVNKFVSEFTSPNTISIDDYFNNSLNFIKIDAEGEELKILKGGAKTLSIKNLKIAVCTYHNPEDAIETIKHLDNNNFVSTFSDKMMIFTDRWKSPFMRKVLLRSIKK